MSANDRTILLVVPVIAAVAAFWLLVLSPKQDEADKLDARITQLQSAVAEQQQAADAGVAARKEFPRDYHRLVVMGKAVPVDDETASLLVQLNRIANRSGVDFRAIVLGGGDSGDTAAATPSTSTTGATTAAPATESAAATLPIGATVGSAGLPTLPYTLTFRGTYFEVADFMQGVDALVRVRKGLVAADGRLVTIDNFTMNADEAFAFPVLKATVQVTTYVTPADQGATAGATPTGPSLASATTTATAP
jgi:Tfp pilus assembly protein PilO